MKLLKDILIDAGLLNIAGGEKLEIAGVSSDSRTAGEGFAFVSVPGTREDGSKYVRDAVSRGAVCVVSEKEISGAEIPVVLVKNARTALAAIARNFYGNPTGDINLIGVTGTNGKTTITYLLETILSASGRKVGVVGTVAYRYGDVEIEPKNTTPGPVELQSLFRDMADAGVDTAVMEVSSHSLEQERVRFCEFDRAVFTNLTQDHLDYHKDMTSYFDAKKKLFAEYLSADDYAVINSDDAWGKQLSRIDNVKVITYGLAGDADIRADGISMTESGTKFSVQGIFGEFTAEIHLIGKHNVYNALGALCTAGSMDVRMEIALEAIRDFKDVPGRLEKFISEKGFTVLVDYAHTPDALENVLKAIGELKTRGVITVFGCGGDRDRKKRPLMGDIASAMSDVCIITSDNPRSEEPESIMNEIFQGVRDENRKKCVLIPDRRTAIETALGRAEKNDIVLIAGKGHENYQIFKDRTVHFDDREIVREMLSQITNNKYQITKKHK